MIEVDVEARLGQFHLQVQYSATADITAFFGPSGSGKTTLLRMIAGLEKPSNGTIKIGDKVLFDEDAGINLPPRQRRIGYVFQDANLFPHFSIRRNLEYSHWAGKRISALDFESVCNVLGIDKLLDRKPATLSGGEKQRVAIGRALLSDPSVLLLDEPLSALDVKRKLEILPFLEKVRDEFSIPMIFISHSVDEVTRLADYLVVLDEGKLVANGKIEDVLGSIDLRGSGYGLEAGSLLVGDCEEVDHQTGLALVSLEGQTLALSSSGLEPGVNTRMRIKANDIALALERPQNTSFQNMLDCEISFVKPLGGSDVEIGLLIGSQQIRARVTKKAVADLQLVEGMNCVALVKAVALEGYAEAPVASDPQS